MRSAHPSKRKLGDFPSPPVLNSEKHAAPHLLLCCELTQSVDRRLIVLNLKKFQVAGSGALGGLGTLTRHTQSIVKPERYIVLVVHSGHIA